MVVSALTLVVVASGGCHTVSDDAQPAAGEIVARYAGHEVTRQHIEDEIKRLPEPSRDYLTTAEHKREFVENLILNELLFEAGRRTGADPDIERQVNELRKRLVVQRLLREYQASPEISDAQVRESYDRQIDFYSTTQVRVRQILVPDQRSAAEISITLRAHPDQFAELARVNSIDAATAAHGGDLGTVGHGRLPPEVERAAFALRVGEVSDPVKSRNGWHILTVTERTAGAPRPFEQVKGVFRKSCG